MFSWISQGLTGVIERLTQGVVNQENFYEYYQQAMNEVQQNNMNIFEKVGAIFNLLNPFSEDFFVYKLIELLGDLLQGLFVPSEERITALTNTVSSKFGFIDTIKNSINSLQTILSGLNSSPKLESSNIESKYYSGKLVIVDMSWYSPFKPYGDLVITGFVYLFFLWRIFVHVPNIIHGAGGDFSSISKE